MKYLLILLVFLCLFTACRKKETPVQTQPAVTATETAAEVTLPPQTTLPAEMPTEAPAVPTTQETQPEPADTDFVKISDYLPNAIQDLRYATDDNFTGQVIYEFEAAWLRYGTVKKLMAVNRDLEELGLAFKVWDAFRPVSAQFRLWEVYPNPTFVANPTVGYSSHSRGNTVDLTLVDENGAELEMPTAFDDFSDKANRDYSDCDPRAADNARILELLMEKHGFTGYFGEWWHFSDTVRYPVENDFDPGNT